ncbi:MAG: hypothetical protein J6M53_06700 [Bacteroidaceae bacterium]|nr:hypothetical protein [Bacteroidaceae bacterium]
MKAKAISAALLLSFFVAPVQAQDIYKVQALTDQDLNGTARFVGMGGAMNALGADLSTMATNPAAIGLYRRNDFAVTGSFTSQPNGESFLDIDKSRASFDQAGLVFKTNVDGNSLKFVNFGFNYQKRRNFKNFVGLDNVPTFGLSQTYTMADMAYYRGVDLQTEQGYNSVPLFTGVGYDAGAILANRDASGNLDPNDPYTPLAADTYTLKRAQWGGLSQFDFSIGLNFDEQIYAGVAFGLYDLNFHSAVDYLEFQHGYSEGYLFQNEEKLTGTGFDVKAGVILRPIAESPFRIGLAIHTPTWYDLTYESYNFASVPDYSGSQVTFTEASDGIQPYDYKVRTPWKFSLAAATTIANKVAIDAEYEYSDLSTCSVSYPDYDDWYSYGSGNRDYSLKDEMKACLKGQSTFRIGAEANVAPGFFVRAGYNYVSAPMKDDAYLNLLVDGQSSNYASGTDFVNLGAINRFTVGLGYRHKAFFADLAYQYQQQEGTVYAFRVYDDAWGQNLAGKKFDLNRNNFMLTLGFKF